MRQLAVWAAPLALLCLAGCQHARPDPIAENCSIPARRMIVGDSHAKAATAGEAQPRGIRIDARGQYLIASGEKSDRISVYKIDQSTGKLGEPNRYPVGNGANWIEIVELQ